MALTKAQKQKILDELKEKIAKQKAMVIVDFTGLKVKDLSNLRKKIKSAGDDIRVAKKTLLGIALKDAQLKIETKKIPGELAVAFGYSDEISPAKITYQFSQENPNLKILGGFLENKWREAEEIIELAQLPTREELLTRLVGSISAPISNFVNVLEGNLRNFIYLISQIKVK